MDFRLNDRQQTLKQNVARFLATAYTPAIARQLEHPLGAGDQRVPEPTLHAEIWNGLVQLGATRFTIPEHLGGYGWGQTEAIVVAEQMGRSLYQGPYFDTLTAAEILLAVDDLAEQQATIRRIARGEYRVSLALPRQHHLLDASPAVTALEDGWSVTGEQRFVACARQVQALLLLARIDDQPGLFLIPADQPQITIRRHDEIGRGELYAVSFNNVLLPRSSCISTGAALQAVYESTRARACIRHAAYLVGLCQGIFDITLNYTKKRVQFGRPIATFQTISHRLASFAARIDAARLLAQQSAWQADQHQDIRQNAYELLALAGELAREWTADALQMHGAYGLTEQAEAQRYYRRSAVDTLLYGSPSQLRAEAAALMAV
jgi:alkylation response protein AidB-like acyl-CoA dehydrogenase